MAIWAICPVWSFVGLLTKFGLLGRPPCEVGPLVSSHFGVGEFYEQFFEVDGRGTENVSVAKTRYGRWGPYASSAPARFASRVRRLRRNSFTDGGLVGDRRPRHPSQDALVGEAVAGDEQLAALGSAATDERLTSVGLEEQDPEQGGRWRVPSGVESVESRE